MKQDSKVFADQWMQSCEYFDRNRKSMEATFVIEFADGKFNIACNAIKKEYLNYKGEMERLANYVAKGAYIISFNTVCSVVNVTEDEKSKEKDFRVNTFKANFAEYLKCLLLSGRDTFINVIYSHAAMLDAAYQMRHLQFDGENWHNFKGDKLVDGIWNTENGARYSDQTSDLLMRITA